MLENELKLNKYLKVYHAISFENNLIKINLKLKEAYSWRVIVCC